MAEIQRSHWSVRYDRVNDDSSKVVLLETCPPPGERGDGVRLDLIMAAAAVEFPHVPFGELFMLEMKHEKCVYLTRGRYASDYRRDS